MAASTPGVWISWACRKDVGHELPWGTQGSSGTRMPSLIAIPATQALGPPRWAEHTHPCPVAGKGGGAGPLWGWLPGVTLEGLAAKKSSPVQDCSWAAPVPRGRLAGWQAQRLTCPVQTGTSSSTIKGDVPLAELLQGPRGRAHTRRALATAIPAGHQYRGCWVPGSGNWEAPGPSQEPRAPGDVSWSSVPQSPHLEQKEGPPGAHASLRASSVQGQVRAAPSPSPGRAGPHGAQTGPSCGHRVKSGTSGR